MKDSAVNIFAEGIKDSFSPLDTPDSALTDAVNGNTFSEKGTQGIFQAMKSNVPVRHPKVGALPIIHRSGQNVGQFTIAPGNLKKIGFLYESAFSSLNDSYIVVTVEYNLPHSPYQQTFQAKDLYEGLFYEIDVDIFQEKKPTVIRWEMFNGDNGMLEFRSYFEAEGNVGIPSENKVLGIKTHKNVAYIISGKKADFQLRKEDLNNTGIKPYDLWDTGSEEDERNQVNNDIISFSENTHRADHLLFTRHQNKSFSEAIIDNSNINVFLYTIEKSGLHTFSVDIHSNTGGKGKVESHWFDLKLMRKQPGGILSEISTVHKDQKSHDLYGNTTPGFEAQVGDEIYIQGRVRARLKLGSPFVGGFRLTLKAKTHLINGPRSLNQSEVITLDFLNVVPATSNIHDNGRFTLRKTSAPGTYRVAIDNNPFVTVNEGATYMSPNLPPGDYSVYIEKIQNGDPFIIKEIVSIHAQNFVEPLKVTSTIYGFTSIRDPFNIRLELDDPSEMYSGKYEYIIRINGELYGNAVSIYSKIYETVIHMPAYPEEGFLLTIEVKEGDTHPLSVTDLSGNPKYARTVSSAIPVNESLNNNRYYLELGSFPSPTYESLNGSLEYIYKPLYNYNGGQFITDQVYMSGKNYPDIEIQPTYDGTVNIVFAEEDSSPRIVNSGFAVLNNNRYSIIERIGGRDTNQYKTDNVKIATMLTQTAHLIPRLNLSAVHNTGGQAEVGMYKFYIKLGTADGNETDVLEESGYIPIFHGDVIGAVKGGRPLDPTSKSIEFTVENIDSSYEHVSLYYVLNSGEHNNTAIAYKINKKFIIPESTGFNGSTVKLTFTGYEEKEIIPVDSLSILKASFNAIKTIAQVQNRLFVGNIIGSSIDYAKLYRIGRKISAIPSLGSKKYKFRELYGSWPLKIEDNLLQFSKAYYETSINNLELPDLNINRESGLYINLSNTSLSQGHFNPLMVEKYTPYWPMESYKMGICFIIDNDTVTQPVPVVAADYLSEEDLNEDILYNKLKQAFVEENIQSWQDVDGLSTNRIGLLRFPSSKRGNVAYFPKFKFSKKDIIDIDPELFSRIKGFFFVRAERKPDVLASGILLPTLGMITEIPTIKDFTNPNDKGIIGFGVISNTWTRSAVPTNKDNYLIYGTETFVGDPKVIDLAKVFIDSLAEATNPDYIDVETGIKKYRYAFKSGDIFADQARMAASFNGNSRGLYHYSQQGSIEYKYFRGDDTVAHFLTVYDSVHLQETAIRSLAKGVITDFVDYGQPFRTGGGFASQIPFKACKSNNNEYPVGNFPAFIGLVSEEELPIGLVHLYSGTRGPLSREAIKTMYANDNTELYTAITPRYSFDDFINDEEVEIIGTRGDCFVTQNTFNISRMLPAVSAVPSSSNIGFQDEHDEFNSVRALEASLSVMVVHPSNYLSFARHQQIEDVVETAAYGRPRSFLPLTGHGDSVIGVNRSFKLPETTAFNKGYKAHFEGRKYVGVSSDAPFISQSDENSIYYSEISDEQAFYNGYRDFHGHNYGTFNKHFGGLTKIIEYNNDLIAVHERGVSKIPVNEETLIGENSSGNIHVRPDSVLPERAGVISSEFGSTWQRSILKTDNSAYGVDVNQSIIWSTATNDSGSIAGIINISTGNVGVILQGFLKDFQGKREIPGELYISTFYHSVTGNVFFVFYNVNNRYTDFPLPMDADLYYMLDDMGTDIARESWVNSPLESITPDKDEAVKRKLLLARYNFIKDRLFAESERPRSLVLIYNEHEKKWTTRLSHAPEFMFSLNNKLYSVNNDHTAQDFTPETNKIFSLDEGKKIFWEHNAVHPLIAPYGSFYGKKPIFEFEFVVNKNPGVEKIFDNLIFIGNNSTPSEIIYQVSEDCEWLKSLVSARTKQYASASEMIDDFNTKMLTQSGLEISDPNSFVRQDVKDRMFHSIIHANYEYDNSKGYLEIGKNLDTMYRDFPETLEKKSVPYMQIKFRDKYIKIRVRYTHGMQTQIKAIVTQFTTMK